VNARQSFRSRNFFNPEIDIPALLFNYAVSPNTQLSVTSHYLGGQRNSVQFINTPNVADTVNTALGTYHPRQVDRAYYSGCTTEARLLHRYTMGKISAALCGEGRAHFPIGGAAEQPCLSCMGLVGRLGFCTFRILV